MHLGKISSDLQKQAKKKDCSPTPCLGLMMRDIVKDTRAEKVHELSKVSGANGVICFYQLLCANMRTNTGRGSWVRGGASDWVNQCTLIPALTLK